MREFEQGMEKARSNSMQAAKLIGKGFLDLNKQLAITGTQGAFEITKIGASAAQMVSPLKALEVAAKSTSLAVSGAGTVAATAWSTGAIGRVAAAAGPWLAVKLAAVATMAAIAGAIQEARDQLERLLQIADGARRTGLSAEVFQGFLLAARFMKIEAKDLEGALERLWQQTKPQINPDWSVWDRTKQKISEVEKALQEYTFELLSLETRPQGLDLFRRATNQDQRLRAVLTAMIELERAGERLAALDLGEKAFGSAFVDKIRQGKTSAEELLATMEKAKGTGLQSGDIFSNELVRRADELDVKLKQANDTLARNLRPAWDGLADVGLTIKDTWTSIVSLLAQAANITKVFGRPAAYQQLLDERAEIIRRLADPQYQGTATQNQLNTRLRKIESDPSFSAVYYSQDTPPPPPREAGVPMPRPRPPDKDKPKAEAETISAFEREEDRIKRRVALLAAEASGVGKTAAEQEKLRTEMLLLQAAEKESNDITVEQIDTYARLRASMGSQQALAAAGIKLTDDQAEAFTRLAARTLTADRTLTRAKDTFAGINDAIRFGGNELVNVIDRATQNGVKFGDIMSDVLRNVSRQLLQAALTGEGAFAKLFGFQSQTGGVGGLGGLLAGLFMGGSGGAGGGSALSAGSGAAAIGGSFAGGGEPPVGRVSLVGERGPELFVPRVSGTIVPNDIVRGMGGGMNVSYAPTYSIAGGVSPEDFARLRVEMENDRRQFASKTVATIMDARRRSVPV